MPSKSYSGPFQALAKDELILRNRLESHVKQLAQQIGERNIWHYAALEASATYILDNFKEFGYLPDIQDFESGGKVVDNLVAEKLGNTLPQEIVVIGAHYDSAPGTAGGAST